MITFYVSGRPIPQGSKKSMVITGRNADIDAIIRYARQFIQRESESELGAIVDRLASIGRWPIRKNNRWLINTIDDNAERLKPWRDAVAAAAKKAMIGHSIITRAVTVELVYFFKRPQSHWGTGRNAGKLKPSAPLAGHHGQQPDGDKLDRAVHDAMTGIVYDDDRRICKWPGEKLWLNSLDGDEGVRVTVY